MLVFILNRLIKTRYFERLLRKMHTKSCPHSLESQLKLFHSKHTQNAALMDLKSLLKSKVKPGDYD